MSEELAERACVRASGFCIMFGCTDIFCPVDALRAYEDDVTVFDEVSCKGKVTGD